MVGSITRRECFLQLCPKDHIDEAYPVLHPYMSRIRCLIGHIECDSLVLRYPLGTPNIRNSSLTRALLGYIIYLIGRKKHSAALISKAPVTRLVVLGKRQAKYTDHLSKADC